MGKIAVNTSYNLKFWNIRVKSFEFTAYNLKFRNIIGKKGQLPFYKFQFKNIKVNCVTIYQDLVYTTSIQNSELASRLDTGVYF